MQMHDNTDRRDVLRQALLRGLRNALLVGAVIVVLVLLVRLLLPFATWLLSGFFTAFGS